MSKTYHALNGKSAAVTGFFNNNIVISANSQVTAGAEFDLISV